MGLRRRFVQLAYGLFGDTSLGKEKNHTDEILIPEDERDFSSPILTNYDEASATDFKSHFSGWEHVQESDLPSPTTIEIIYQAGSRAAKFGIFLELAILFADLARSFAINEGFSISFFSDARWQFSIGLISIGHAISSLLNSNGSVTKTRQGSSIKTVWVGSGQLQFGCGPKGISVDNPDKFLYMLQWSKVKDVYDGDDPFDQRKANLRSRSVETDASEAEITKDWEGEIADERGQFLPRYWAPSGCVTVRLKAGDHSRSVEVLLIPKRFFPKSEDSMSWDVFMLHCKRYLAVHNQQRRIRSRTPSVT